MKQKIIITILLISFITAPFPARARFYDPNDIISDAELFDSNALSRTAIQNFLEAKNSVLKSVSDTINGVPKLVSEMIYEIGKEYGVSQKFLLAKLQHEQGLIGKTSASQKKLDWATGYSCYGGRCNEKYRGIYTQLDATADTQKIYAERSKSDGYFGYQVGKESTTKDGYPVKPVNQATTNLYIYTPYHGSLSGIGGNLYFSRVWNKYFTERVYTDGTLLRNKKTGEYWKIEDNKKRKFASASVYLSDYSAQDAVSVSEDRLSYYHTADPITISNNTLVTTDDSGIMYLISDNKKHRLVGHSALAALGMRLASPKSVTPVVVKETTLNSLEEGEPITDQSVYPAGQLVKSDNSAIYYVKHGIKHLLLDEAVWQENFNRKEPIYVSKSTLASYKTGDPVELDDGALIKSKQGKIYIVSNGKKKRIASEDIVKRVFNLSSLEPIPEASDRLLSLTESGDPIDYIDDTVQDPPNYVPYASRVASETDEPEENPYFALFDILDAPKSIRAGETATITVRFRNRGDVSWPAKKTYLKLIDENHTTSSFIEENRLPLEEAVTYNKLAVFEVQIQAPEECGKIKEWFMLEYTDSNGNIYEMPGGMKSQYINIVSDVSGEIVDHSIPAAISNESGPREVEVKIKNTSDTQTWTSRRAAFKIHGGDDSESLFYDPYDWIDEEVAAVPINSSYIAPGETGVMRFTLDPRGVRPATYKLVFSMDLRDAGEPVYLNGAREWELLIRVDD